MFDVQRILWWLAMVFLAAAWMLPTILRHRR